MVRKIHFYKARSRLGIINPTINEKDLNIGVEDGPDAILTKEFLKHFDSVVSEFTFSKPEHINKSKYLDLLASESNSFKDLINKTLKPREIQAIIGGDNSITFSSLLALLDRVKDLSKVGYVQFDSHGEMNLYKTSPSKNFHGMYLRPFLDSFDVPRISSMVNSKLSLKNTLFIGDLKLDSEEEIYFSNSKIRNVNREAMLIDKKGVLEELESFIARFPYLHVNFDIDVFNNKEVMAIGIPSSKGFMFGELVPLLEIVSKHPNLSLDLSEVNPQKSNRDKTIKIAQKVLLTILL